MRSRARCPLRASPSISGLAQGIDAAAHEGALPEAGSTIAVVGTGLDRVYPARNRELAHAIAAGGSLLSEFVPGTPPLKWHFPRRNRLISGLSRGVLVIEAKLSSGSLITARLAGEQGREVMALPGSIHSPLSKGCHKLIREGAKLVETAQDVLGEIGLDAAPAPRPQPAPQSAAASLTRRCWARWARRRSTSTAWSRAPGSPRNRSRRN